MDTNQPDLPPPRPAGTVVTDAMKASALEWEAFRSGGSYLRRQPRGPILAAVVLGAVLVAVATAWVVSIAVNQW